MTKPEIIPPDAKPKRPADFTEEIFDTICERMANGQGLRKICEDPEMPSRQTFLRWIEKDTGRQDRYQAAREALMDWYGEEILTIAWDDSKDTVKGRDDKPLCNHEWIQRSRLKVDTLKFLMSKLHPKRYGDKLPEVVHNAGPLSVRWQNNMTDEQLVERINSLDAAIGANAGGAKTFNRIDLVGVRPTVDDLMKAVDGRTRSAYPDSPAEPAKPASEPLALAYNPTQPPADLSPEAWSAIARVSELIEQIAPSDTLPEHVFGLIEGFLRSHFLNAAA